MALDLFGARDATFNADGTLRWTLSRSWGAGKAICYVGHNPSFADESRDDMTAIAWVRHGMVNGCGRYVAVNVYPYRATDAAACRAWLASAAPADRARNLAVIADAARSADIVVACWGALAVVPADVEEVAAILAGFGPIMCLGKTSSGAPKHPMARGRHRVPADQKFIVWR